MAKVIKVMEPFEQLSGKVCQHSDFIINLGRKGVNKGQMWTGKICNPRDLEEHPYSTNENTAHERFKDVREAVQEIKTNPTKLANAYDGYKMVRDNYKSFTSYLWKVEMQKWNAENAGGGDPEVQD